MKELGDDSKLEHEAIISLIDQHKWNDVILVGNNFAAIKNKYHNFENALQASDWLKSQNVENAYFLIKGSRSMQMEKVLE